MSVLREVMELSEMRRSLLHKGANVIIRKAGMEGKRGVVERVLGRTGIVQVKLEDDTIQDFRHSHLSLARDIKTEEDEQIKEDIDQEKVKKIVVKWENDIIKLVEKAFDKNMIRNYNTFIRDLEACIKVAEYAKKEIIASIKDITKESINRGYVRLNADKVEDNTVGRMDTIIKKVDQIATGLTMASADTRYITNDILDQFRQLALDINKFAY